MSVSTIRTRSDVGTSCSPNIHSSHNNGWWRVHSRKPVTEREIRPTSQPVPFRSEHRSQKARRKETLARFFANYTGPIVLLLEAATVALVIAFRSTDVVRAIVVANLALMVVAMAFKASLCIWQEPTSDDTYNHHSTSTAKSHHG